MKKTKKVLSMLLGSMIAVSTISSFNANAASYFVSEPFNIPENYTEYEDTEELFYWFMSAVRGQEQVYTVYYEDDGNDIKFHLYHNYKYNHTVFTVLYDKIEEFDAIYAEYKDVLDMDYYDRQNPGSVFDPRATFYDMYDENGNETKDPTVMKNKQELISEFTEKLYAAGCISEANYMGVTASTALGWHTNIMSLCLKETSGTEVDALNEIARAFDEDAETYYYESSDSYAIKNLDFYKTADVIAGIKAVYPEVYGNIGMFQMGSDAVLSGETNLIEEIEETNCDTDQNGTVEITDATAILASYANTAAGIAAASAENPMDVNGDGAVGIDDATFVLTVYAELAAGMR